MKVAIVNSNEFNLSECMSAARGVKYTADDFKDIDKISNGFEGYRENDLAKFCKRVEQCTIKKCNLKKGIAKHKKLIMKNMKRRIDETTKETIRNIEQKMDHIERSMKSKVTKISKSTEV